MTRLKVAILCLLAFLAVPATAQEIATPNFWDQRQRLAKPPLAQRERIRFLTSVDYPPFNFLDGRGRLTGLNVELMRLACEELGLLDRCQIEARPFTELLPALAKGEADAVVAGIAITAENRRELAFTQSYFRYPARFVTLRETPLAEPLATSLAGRRVGVVAGGAHAAMLASFFPAAVAVPVEDPAKALDALRAKSVDAVFGDGVSLAFWLDSAAAADCCAFSGGPFLSERFLGEGLAVAVPKADAALADALDYAFGQIVAKKAFSELILRYFPTSPF